MYQNRSVLSFIQLCDRQIYLPANNVSSVSQSKSIAQIKVWLRDTIDICARLVNYWETFVCGYLSNSTNLFKGQCQFALQMTRNSHQPINPWVKSALRNTNRQNPIDTYICRSKSCHRRLDLDNTGGITNPNQFFYCKICAIK